MFEFLGGIESRILIALADTHTPFADAFMMLFTSRFVWVPLYLTLFAFLVKRYGWKNAVGYLLLVTAVIAMADQACATLIRPYVARLRPTNIDNPLSEMLSIVNGYRGGSYGFPSCHAANTFALAVLLTLLTRSRILGTTLFLWAAMNCYTRLYLGVHYPSDILAGIILGSTIAALAYWALREYVNFSDIRGDRNAWWVAAAFAATVIAIIAMSFHSL